MLFGLCTDILENLALNYTPDMQIKLTAYWLLDISLLLEYCPSATKLL
jgi:hypothetical protein